MNRKTCYIAIVFVASLALLLFTPASVNANSPVTITVDGSPVYFHNQGPVIINGRILVPVHEVFAKMGFHVCWDSYNHTVYIAGVDTFMQISANSPYYWFFGYYRVAQEVPWQYINGQFMVPLRAIAETLGASVYWDNGSRVANVVSPEHILHAPFNIYGGTFEYFHTIFSFGTFVFYGVKDGTTVAVVDEMYISDSMSMDYAFDIWARLNNVRNVSLVEFTSDIITTRSHYRSRAWLIWYVSRTIDITLSSEFMGYFESDKGLLLAQSMANTFMDALMRSNGGHKQVNLIVDNEIIFSTTDFVRWQCYGEVRIPD